MNHLIKFAIYTSKRKAYDEAHAKSSAAYAEMVKAERELIDEMNNDGVSGFETTGDAKLKVSLRRNFSIAVNKDNEFQIREWLTDTEGDVAMYTKEELNKTAISDLIKKKVVEGIIDEGEVPEFFKLKTTPSLMVRGWDKNGEEG